MTVTPWEVKGAIDYDKLIADFGVSRIDTKLLARLEQYAAKKGMKLHRFLRRNIFFAQRDLKMLLDAYEAGTPFFLYTGRSPSGHTHMGHLVPWEFTKWLQDVFDVELWFQFPDDEKFLFKRDLTFEDVQHFLAENMLDVIAVGFDPKKTKFLIDTKHAQLMYPQALRVAKHINFSTVKSVFGFDASQNIGAIFYTAMQAVPAFLPSVVHGNIMNCLIPYAIDQDAHFRVSRDVIPKLGYPKPASIQCRFLPGLGGMMDDGKMSSSSGDQATIYTVDSPLDIKKKINKYAFSGGQATIEEHRAKGGNPDIDVAYQWLTFFEESDERLAEIYRDYKAGTLLSGELKAILIEKMQTYLTEHQQRREAARTIVDSFIYRG